MYILRSTEQEELIKRFVHTKTLDDGWTKTFINPVDNHEWLLFYHHGEMQGGGFRVLRENPPNQQLSEWLTTCFATGNDDDIQGLAWELSTKYEQLPEILDWLDVNSNRISKKQIQLFIRNLEILNATNKRPIIGKTSIEIEKNVDDFKKLAERAMSLISNPKN